MHTKNDKYHTFEELIFEIKRLQSFVLIDKNRKQVAGDVVLGLYKGNITILSRRTKNKAYSLKKVSFEENKTFNKSKIENFIKHHSKQLNKS